MVEMRTLTIETPEGEETTYEVVDAQARKDINNIKNNGAGGLPEVSASDNGKFLRVVDGAWIADSIAEAEGVSF